MLGASSKSRLLIKSIELYLSTVKFYEALICEEFGVRQGNCAMKSGHPRVGSSKLIDPFYYSFHGVGCVILSGNPDEFADDKAIVDWDYHEIDLTHFRQGFFKKFVSENYPALFEWLGGNDGIDKLIEKAISGGLIDPEEGTKDHRFLTLKHTK